MKVLVIGSGGREHALVWKIKQSPLVKCVYCAPGNGGIEGIAECVDIKVNDFEGLINFAKEKKVGLTVVGPEAPLVDGIVDAFEREGLKVFGPNRQAAQLEGSKVFTKEFLKDCNIPTAAYQKFDDASRAKSFLQNAQFPIVVKADGLAAGKGVIICKDYPKACEAVEQIMTDKVFKEAGSRIVIEECLVGQEASILAISDGENFCLMAPSQDHKKIFDDDMGPNTGGMGAFSPVAKINEDMLKKIENRIIEPSIRGMKRNNMPFRGVLYAGLMLTAEGPMVLEFNVRFGDPEIQAILPRLKTDIVEVMLASIEGRMDEIQLEWEDRSCICVVMSSGGYPGEYKTGFEIQGLDKADKLEDVVVFHAGTKLEDKKIITSGGRVLGVTAMGKSIEKAIERVYEAVESIEFEKCFFRRDIGAKAVGEDHPRRATTAN